MEAKPFPGNASALSGIQFDPVQWNFDWVPALRPGNDTRKLS